MTANELLTVALKMCDEALSEGEKIKAYCYIHMKSQDDPQILALDYNAAPFTPERTAKQQAIILAIRGLRGLGAFEGAVLISEAWMKRMKGPYTGPYDKAIAEDPERIDSLIIFAHGSDRSRRMMAWELKPTTKGTRCRAVETVMDSDDPDLNMEGWIDKAFHDEQEGEA